ncbi:MAG TPA: ribbon-helix-helix protein, CopG family [Gammaproteobacteria bacterium]|nr:ribbon-helix-helix protein, CopG family [Gammaproteobacteria bacterium]
MTAISLKLPDDLAQESKSVAEKIGISRTELIRQALRHELDEIEARLERAAMAEALQTMRNDSAYIQESEAVYGGLSESLPDEPENWWQG